jgi:hypothetical protein
MRAAFLTEPEPPEAIPVGELPVPVPGLRDVLVAVEVKKVMKPAVEDGLFDFATSINFAVDP